MVPQDRPGPALNIIANFLTDERNYNTSLNISMTPKPLLNTTKLYQIKPKVIEPMNIEPLPFNAQKPDKILSLPGLSYNLNFNQYSGYLNGAVKGNYLFYW